MASSEALAAALDIGAAGSACGTALVLGKRARGGVALRTAPEPRDSGAAAAHVAPEGKPV